MGDGYFSFGEFEERLKEQVMQIEGITEKEYGMIRRRLWAMFYFGFRHYC